MPRASVRDLWTKRNPDRTSRTTKIRTTRWGIGYRWQVVWTENGKVTTKTFPTQDAAKLYASRIEIGQAEGTWITKDKQDITINDLWEPFIASKAGRSKKTQDTYKTAWNHIKPIFGDTPACDIERHIIAAWIPTLTTTKGCKENEPPKPLGSSSKRKIGVTLKALLDQAVELDVLPRNPMKPSDVPRQEKTERMYLTVAEADRLIAAAQQHGEIIELYIRVLLFTGPRPGEARGLKVKDLDSPRSRLMIRRDVDALGNPDETKTRHHRDVPCGGDLMLDLELSAENKDPEDWLLPDTTGHVWTDARWRVIWPKLLAAANISQEFDAYGLRHTSSSLAIAAGADPKQVQRMLGHSSAGMTLDVYSHLWDSGLDELPEAIESHMAAERERTKARRDLRAERAEKRRHLRTITGGKAS